MKIDRILKRHRNTICTRCAFESDLKSVLSYIKIELMLWKCMKWAQWQKEMICKGWKIFYSLECWNSTSKFSILEIVWKFFWHQIFAFVVWYSCVPYRKNDICWVNKISFTHFRQHKNFPFNFHFMCKVKTFFVGHEDLGNVERWRRGDNGI